MPPAPLRNSDGSPTASNPTLTIGGFGPAPLGVPNIVIDQFAIPPFLLPIYQACGTQYGIPWQVLASINRIETAFGTNLNVSTAGALGWMQFMPSTFEMYGVDANKDAQGSLQPGRRDLLGGQLPEGGRRPDRHPPGDLRLQPRRLVRRRGHALRPAVRQPARGPDRVADRPHRGRPLPGRRRRPLRRRHLRAQAVERAKPGQGNSGNASDTITDSPTRRGIGIYADEGAPVVAVNDGVITEIGKSNELGKYVVLQDAYGNRYTYAELGNSSPPIRRPRAKRRDRRRLQAAQPAARRAPGDRGRAKATRRRVRRRLRGAHRPGRHARTAASASSRFPVAATTRTRPRPRATRSARSATWARWDRSTAAPSSRPPDFERFRAYTSGILKFNREDDGAARLTRARRSVAGTRARRGRQVGGASASHINFSIRPAGRGAPTIDPKPILDGWKLLEATAIYRVADKDPFANNDRVDRPDPAASKEQLAAARARRPEALDLRVRAPGHPDRPDRPPDPGPARVPGRPRLSSSRSPR